MSTNDFVVIGSDPMSNRYFIHERQNKDGQPGKISKMADGEGDVKEVCKHYIEKGFDPSKIIINGQPATDVLELKGKEKENTNPLLRAMLYQKIAPGVEFVNNEHTMNVKAKIDDLADEMTKSQLIVLA